MSQWLQIYTGHSTNLILKQTHTYLPIYTRGKGSIFKSTGFPTCHPIHITPYHSPPNESLCKAQTFIYRVPLCILFTF